MGILDGDIAALFGAAFSGMYLDGVYHDGTGEPVYDDSGKITGYTGDGIDIKVQTDRVSALEKQSDGYHAGDVKLIVLAKDGFKPDVDGQLTDGYGDMYRLADVDQDAARSHWICRGSPV